MSYNPESAERAEGVCVCGGGGVGGACQKCKRKIGGLQKFGLGTCHLLEGGGLVEIFFPGEVFLRPPPTACRKNCNPPPV